MRLQNDQQNGMMLLKFLNKDLNRPLKLRLKILKVQL